MLGARLKAPAGLSLAVAAALFVVAGCAVVDDPVAAPGMNHFAEGIHAKGGEADSGAELGGEEDRVEEAALSWDEGCGGVGGPTVGGGCCVMPPVPASGSRDAQRGCPEGTYCRSFRDAPPDPDAGCESLPQLTGGRVLATGTVFDLSSLLQASGLPVPLSRVRVDIMGGLQAALDPFRDGLVTLESDSLGRFDAVVPAGNQPVGIVAVQRKDGYYPSITGVIADKGGYEKVAANHDYFIVPEKVVEDFNAALAGIPRMGSIGRAGGVIAIVRDPTSGPVAGARLVSRNPASKARVAYLRGDRTFEPDGPEAGTGETGIAVITGVPATGEQFHVVARDGADIYPWNNTAGAVPDAVFTMIMNVRCGSHC